MNWFNFGNVFFLGQVDTVIGVLVRVDTCESECLNLLGSKRKDLFKFCNLGFKVGIIPAKTVVYMDSNDTCNLCILGFIQNINGGIKR